MKKTFIKDIRERDSVLESFLVSKKETGISKTGKAYLNLRLMDSTGEMEARVWEDAEEVGKAFNRNDVAMVKGFAVAYQGGVQLNVSSVKPLKDGEYELRDYLPASEKPPEVLSRELLSVIAGMRDRHLRGLLEAIFSDPDVKGRFFTAPAAKSMHHPYLGGLAEHVLSICGLVDRLSEHYGECVNRDLLVSGAILHDIGKIYELSYQRSFEYTDEGRLLGHITIGVELIDRKLYGLPDFPRELAMLLKHMILSHHGTLEFGSPKRPKTLEAIMLSYLDDLDAKINTVRALLKDRTDGSSWTSYQKLFERYIYRGAAPAPAPEEGPHFEREENAAPGDAKPGTLNLFK